MMQLLFIFVCLCKLNTLTWCQPVSTNSLNENYDDDDKEQRSDDIPELERKDENNMLSLIDSNHNEKRLRFSVPITAVSIDYLKNTVIVHFGSVNSKKTFPNFDREMEEKRRALNQNFMRFGRSRVGGDFLRFGKRKLETYPKQNIVDSDFLTKLATDRLEGNPSTTRDSRSDNFMRFGRKSLNSLLLDHSQRSIGDDDFMRFGENQNLMRFGRSAGVVRVKQRGVKANFMRFGRTKFDVIRKLIKENPYSRYGRTDSFMRFGRDPPSTDNSNFMRFGRSYNSSTASTTAEELASLTNEGGSIDSPLKPELNYRDQTKKIEGYNNNHDIVMGLSNPIDTFE